MLDLFLGGFIVSQTLRMAVMLTDHLDFSSSPSNNDWLWNINKLYVINILWISIKHIFFIIVFFQHSSTVEYLQPSGSLDFKITLCETLSICCQCIYGREGCMWQTGLKFIRLIKPIKYIQLSIWWILCWYI